MILKNMNKLLYDFVESTKSSQRDVVKAINNNTEATSVLNGLLQDLKRKQNNQ